MKPAEVLSELEKIAKLCGVKVSYESLASRTFSGGLCWVKGKHRIIVDKRQGPAERVNLIADSLSRIELGDYDDSSFSKETLCLLAEFRKDQKVSA